MYNYIGYSWYEKIFTDEEVEAFKKETDLKNEMFGYNNMNSNYQTRWIGTPVELCFKEFLDEFGWEYIYHVEADRKDDLDFTVGRLKIDVKGVSAKTDPEKWYGCNLYEKQWEKIQEKQKINALVFGRYVLPENRAILMGWLPFYEFEDLSKFYEVGSKRGKLIIDTAMHEVQISKLRQLIDIDRFK